MITKREYIFWVIIWVTLTLFFSSSLESLVMSFYFVTILMPVVIATSVFFNRYLVPRFLLQDKKIRFTLYLVYMLIVSIYLELLVMVLAFVILADHKIENLGKIAGDIYLLTVVLYLVVLIEGLIIAVKKLRDKSNEVTKMHAMLEKEKQTELVIRSNRKQILLQLKEILIIESLGDYVKIKTTSEAYHTKEKISSLEERLPDSFIRVHRSFIVNKELVTRFSREEIQVSEHLIPIGRKYRKASEEILKKNAIV